MAAKEYSLRSNGSQKVSTHFFVREFRCNDGSDKILIDPALPKGLEEIWSYFAQKSTNNSCTIKINSAYRTESWNKQQGGATNSRHLYGEAADIVVKIQKAIGGGLEQVPPKEVYDAAIDIGFNGAIVYSTFTHVDVRSWTYHNPGSGSSNTESAGSSTTGQALSDDTSMDNFNVYDEKYTTARGLLSPSEYERRYGISVYDANQPLIKFSTAQGVGESNALLALRKYAKYIFYMLNSAMDVASMTLPGAPWLRPGFNIWIDPVGIDKIYYVNKIQHIGSASTNSVMTTLTMSFGRDRVKFLDGRVNFGAKASGANSTDNVFVNRFKQNASNFGKIVNSPSDFKRIRNKVDKFYQADGGEIIQALNNEHFSEFYGKANIDDSIPGKDSKASSSIEVMPLGKEFGSISDIQSALNTMYAKAPAIVKTRGEKLSKIIKEADSYIQLHYDSEMLYTTN